MCEKQNIWKGEKNMAVVTFGMTWQVSGTQTFNIPDEIDPENENEVSDYLLKHWREISLPEKGEYVSESDTLDGIRSVQRCDQDVRTLYFTVERTERSGFEMKVSGEKYEEFLQTGEFPFDVYKEAGFAGDDGAEYDYAVTDDEGHTVVDWD